MKIKSKKNLPIWALVIMLIIAGSSCKSKKKVSEISDRDKTETTDNDQTSDAETDDTTDEVDNEEDTSNDETKREEKMTVSSKLSYYFASISNASSVEEANSQINEALKLFESPGSLVLIIINKSGNQKDYDRPTTAKEYLNYLKDQKKNINMIDSFKTNSAGKITELELIKQK